MANAEKQIEAARNELGRVEESISKTIDHSNINNLINEASSGLATASLAMKSADEIISRETSVEKRQIAKQYMHLKVYSNELVYLLRLNFLES